MDVRIADAAAVENERVIEQGAVPFPRGFQLPEEFGEERNMKCVDLGHARDFFRIVAVMRKRVVRIGHADLRVSAIARFARELEGNDAGDIALQCEHLQIEHQSRMVGVSRGHPDRPIEIG